MDRSRKPYSRNAPRPRGAEGEWLHDRAPAVPRAVSNTNGAATSASSKLIVSGLHYELTTKDLTQIFGQVGTLVREPLIRYDRSGRSSGVAIISYETAVEAAAAKERYDGKLAKGQPMSIEFHHAPPQQPRGRRSASAPSSLINRIQKPPLLDRLSRNEAPRKPAQEKSGTGPIRTKKGAARAPKKVKTAEELDMEIEQFMKDDILPSQAPAAAQQVDGDVEMA